MLTQWFKHLSTELRDQLLVIDGKRLKGASTSGELMHVVEVFAAENRFVLAQEKVPDKTTEPKALPALLENIDVEGALISMDALFTNGCVVQQILEKKGDYLLGLKGNQGLFHDELSNFFEQAHAVEYEGVVHTRHQTNEKGHGRIEQRIVCVVNDLEWIPQRDMWCGLSSLIEVRSERQRKGKINSLLYLKPRGVCKAVCRLDPRSLEY